MDRDNTDHIKKMFMDQGKAPNKLLGQNFLVDQNILASIMEAADISSKDIIVEVGPGTGILTKALAEKAKKVIAIEKDSEVLEILQENIKGFENVEVINKDILKAGDLGLTDYKLVANIPYYLTSHLIRIFLESKQQPSLIILMIQKEVAQRICAKTPDMNLLAASVQFYADVKIIRTVSKNSFWPRPKIDSAIIQIIPRKELLCDSLLFFKIMKAGFSQPRKQLANNLSKELEIKRADIEAWLAKNNLSPQQRAETLTIQDWINLVATFPEK